MWKTQYTFVNKECQPLKLVDSISKDNFYKEKFIYEFVCLIWYGEKHIKRCKTNIYKHYTNTFQNNDNNK